MIVIFSALSVKEERAKQDSETIMDPQKCCHNRENHGLNSDIDENTSVNDVRAPNLFERAKEEFQALAQVLHHKKNDPTCDISVIQAKAKAANILRKAKKEIKGIIHHEHHHHKETHGRNDDINENTPANEVKGPNVYERVKEEFQAVFQAIHPEKET
ncbi:hypothetical protein Fmac_020644 [Flemingia macrophylla]|uniref:Uncharacterized protein n=1 Tax=Flemingia macrophylla TaxID=520843 RepID=A0ABD1LUL3_9FABA